MSLKSFFGISGNKELSEQEKWDALQKAKETAKERLFKAIRKENLPEIDQILAEYPDAKNWKDKEGDKGRSLLHYALQKDCLKSFTHLLDIGISTDTSFKYKYWEDPLFRWHHYFKILDATCWLNKKDFAYAYLQRNRSSYPSSEALKEAGSAIKGYLDRSEEIYTEYQEKKSLSYALDAEKKAEEKLKQEQEALDKLKKYFFSAIKSGDLAAIENALEKHPEALTWKEKDSGLECLFYAMEVKNIESFRALIHLGANINKQINTEGNGAYPIHYAAVKNLKDYVEILVQRGANTSVKCGWGSSTHRLRPELHSHSTAFDIARDLEHKEIISILENAEKIRADYVAAHKETLKKKEKPAKPAATPAGTQTEAPIGPDALQVILKEFTELKKMVGEFNSLKEKQAETEKQLAATRRELDELKDPGNVVKLPRKEM